MKMKGFTLALMCLVALAQGRSTGEQPSSHSQALPGEAPWIVNLRLATSTNGGLLNSCAGSLIDPNWILTTASCLENVTFIWTRYGAVNTMFPELVTENGISFVRVHPEYDAETGQNDVALININRYVHSSDNIKPIALQKSEVILVGSSKYCGFGESATGGVGNQLSCFEVSVNREDGELIVTPQSQDAYASEFDRGAPVVTDNTLVGLLVKTPLSEAGAFLPIHPYINWIEEEAEISL